MSHPAKIKLVRQREPWDCSIACLAMFAGEEYDTILHSHNEISKLYLRTPKLVYWDESISLLKSLRFHPREIFGWMPNVPAILTVPSLNFKGRWHCIVYDGEAIFDPQDGNPGKEFYTMPFLLENFSVVQSIINDPAVNPGVQI